MLCSPRIVITGPVHQVIEGTFLSPEQAGRIETEEDQVLYDKG